MKPLLILIFLFFIKNSIADDMFNSDFKENKNLTLCVIEKKEPKIQPNIYFCNASECCLRNGEPGCCIGDTKFSTWLITSIGPAIFFCTAVYILYNKFNTVKDKIYKHVKPLKKGVIIRFLFGEDEMCHLDPIFNQNKTRKLVRYRM